MRQNAVIETGVQEVRQPSFENFEATDKNFYDIDYQLKKSGGSFDSHEVPQHQLGDAELTELTISQTDLLELESATAGKISALFDDVDFMQLKAVELQCLKDTTDYFGMSGSLASLDVPSTSTNMGGVVTSSGAPTAGTSSVRIEYSTHGAGWEWPKHD